MSEITGIVPSRKGQRWWMALWPTSEHTILLALAIAVGLATGFCVWLFRQGIDFFQRVFREGLSQAGTPLLGAWAIIPVLALAGVIVGFLMDRFIGGGPHPVRGGVIVCHAPPPGAV